ncbi:MAG: hypothetical protein COX07_05955 [Bacteroidetes bacterium CG23_combo_of_CG06-09_8_20_14_all_32_9]|nr:MAG: hypothetical protein COX07_05955 [Bacteroidetes bacterium CG23_combo_of_CG06-09_8_20_14_all_32_9]
MLIVGTGGLAKEILSFLLTDEYSEEITFYDENLNVASVLYHRFKVIKSENGIKNYFKNKSPDFIVGIGNPRIREKLTNKMKAFGGKNSTAISKQVAISPLNNYPEGTIIEPFVGISHGLEMGEGCAIHVHASIGHIAKIGKYVNVGPGATIVGPIEIGDYTYLGAKALIMPDIKIGKQVIVLAGITVNRDLKDFETFTG